ncbi:CSAD decarboxylase, partial [Syrrhaptes paradoxus]|nr:CSAD decarboxylase [Syrrhaptes paradoxus]
RYTYEIAPVFVLMEELVLAKLRELVGWSSGDGIFCPGGSMSNMFAMNVARFRRFPESRRRGSWALPRLVLFASREVRAGGCWPPRGGFGVNGAEPFFVCATCGTTVLGAFDPLGSIAAICQRHGLWLHVDAAWGGSALLSAKHRHLLAGIERRVTPPPPSSPKMGSNGDPPCPHAGDPPPKLSPSPRADSVAWNPHKMLTVGLQCSAFLLRDTSVRPPSPPWLCPTPAGRGGDRRVPPPCQGLLQRCHGAGATYLFQADKFYDVSYDTGDKTPQCGRRVDCLKLWLLWKALGTRGLATRVERAFACTRYLAEEVKRREGFRLVLEVRLLSPALGGVAPAIKERMMRKGSMMVGYQPHGTKVNFFRQIVTSPAVTKADLDFFLDE